MSQAPTINTAAKPTRRSWTTGFRLAAVLGVAILLQLASASGAQESAEPADEPVADTAFAEVIEVELVNVRVWVSDRKGRPVTGLRAQDFSVKVDGEPMTLTHFSESRRGEEGKLSAAGSPAAGIPAAEAPAEEPSSIAPPDARSRLIFYLDELHMGALDRRRVIEDLRRVVAEQNVPAADILILQQAVDLKRVLTFGSSAEQVDQALEGLLEPPGGEGRAPLEKKLAIDRIWQQWEAARQLSDRDPCQFFTRSAKQEAVVYAEQAASRSRVTLRHLEEVSSSLAGLEGFKALLYVGNLLEVHPGQDLMEIVHGLCPRDQDALPSEIGAEELSTRFDQVAQRANAGQVTLYTLQSGGLRTGSLTGPDQKSADIRVSGAFDRALRSSGRGGLEQLALETGGEAFLNQNHFDRAIGEVAEDLESFYSLGFPPPEEARDAPYRLDVKVRGNGLRVRHRKSIRLRSARRQIYEKVMSAIHLGESQNPLGVRLGSGALRQSSDGVLTLPLFVRVPVEAVTFLPTASGDAAELEVMVAARSPEHRGMPPATRVYRLERPAEPAGLLDLAMELQLAPGVYVLGVGVRDRSAGTQSFVSTSIAVGPVDPP